MANDFTEKLFQSIDTIVSSRLKKLEYDQTIICEVKNISESEFGIYQVESQGALMTVYSERKDFAVGDFVYVLIPLGDYSGKKTIIEKVIGEKDSVVSGRPFESFASVTDNLNTQYGSALDEHTFVVNKDYDKILFQKIFNNPKDFLGYDMLGIKLSISANLKTMTQKVISGKYKIIITLNGVDLTDTTTLDYQKTTSKTFDINMEDMIFINPYVTEGYCNQEKTFNIKNFAPSAIQISVKQIENFLDEEDAQVSSDSFFISFKEIYCTFGYECSNNLIGTQKLYAYSMDGLRYNSQSKNKKLNARLIKFSQDDKKMLRGIIQDITDIAYNGWGRYSPESSYTDNIFKIMGYSLLTKRDDASGKETAIKKENGYYELPLNLNKGMSENKFIMSITSQPITSNEVIFVNNDYVKNAELLDSIMGFSGKISDGRESFNVYGLDNKLLNDFEENHIFYFIVSYNSVNDRHIKEKDTISWSFPESNTMIIPYPNSEKNSYTVTVGEKIDGYDGYTAEHTYRIPFKIKNIYNQNFVNNTITCNFKFTDDSGHSQTASISKTLLFGFSGSEGSKYIYNLELYKGTEKIQSIYSGETDFKNYGLKLKVYDYNMDSIETSNLYTFKYKWFSESDSSFMPITDDPKKVENFLKKFKDIQKPQDRIIVIQCFNNADQKIVSVSYHPVGTIHDKNYNNQTSYLLEGCKTIVYDTLGIKPYYYKGAYKFYKNSAIESSTFVLSGFNNNIPESMRPVLSPDNKIKPYGAYVEGLTNCSILVKQNDSNTYLEFPIVIIQSQYSAMAENQDSQIQLTFINNSEILDKVLLGYVNSEKDGLVIGQKPDNAIGIYTYIDGDVFFTLDKKQGFEVKGIVNEDGGSNINLWNGNLHEFELYDCSGSITSAKKLINSSNKDFTVGSASEPVYFKNGIPVACDSIATSSQINSLTQEIDRLKETIKSLRQQIENLSK